MSDMTSKVQVDYLIKCYYECMEKIIHHPDTDIHNLVKSIKSANSLIDGSTNKLYLLICLQSMRQSASPTAYISTYTQEHFFTNALYLRALRKHLPLELLQDIYNRLPLECKDIAVLAVEQRVIDANLDLFTENEQIQYHLGK